MRESDAGDGDRTDPELVERARAAARNAHIPYSGYAVGAALETADGTVYTGCNIENANYSNSLHAEEVAVAAAVKRGHEEFTRLAVSSGARDGVTPCGMCRQTLAEFCAGDLRVLCDLGDGAGDDGGGESTGDGAGDDGAGDAEGPPDPRIREYDLGTLLPDTITAETLGK